MYLSLLGKTDPILERNAISSVVYYNHTNCHNCTTLMAQPGSRPETSPTQVHSVGWAESLVWAQATNGIQNVCNNLFHSKVH